MENKTNINVCPVCGEKTISKFCPNCGVPMKPYNEVDEPVEQSQQTEPKKDDCPISDEGLTLLVDACRKTLATVGGDGHDEICLYLDEATGQYSLHTYYYYQYMEKEVHKACYITEEDSQAILDKVDETNIIQYDGVQGIGLCGGDFVCKFKKGDKMIRISTSNCGSEGINSICEIKNFMHSKMQTNKDE